MKNKIAGLVLSLASMGFCVDEYLPVKKGKTEVDLGYNPQFGLGGWNGTHKVAVVGSPVTHNVPFQVKYGLLTGLDAEAAWTFSAANDDAKGTGLGTGFGRPDLALKYALPADRVRGLGVFLDVLLPFATGDYDVPGRGLGFTPGVVYDRNFGRIEAVAKASYLFNLKDQGVTAPNILDIYLKPGYAVSDKLGVYAGLDYKQFGAGKPSVVSSGFLFTILPGATYAQTPSIAYEINVPVTLLGKNQPASWGVWASIYLTLPM